MDKQSGKDFNRPAYLRMLKRLRPGDLLIDDLHCLKDSEQQRALCQLICSAPNLRFVLLSRGRTPGWLMPFRFAGIMEMFEMETLLFDRGAVRELLTACDWTDGNTTPYPTPHTG